MNDTTFIDTLLEQTVAISKRQWYNDKKNPEIGYNFFTELGIQNKEKTHSNFIASLLNPNGAHNEQSLFLDEFLRLLDFDPKDFDSGSAVVNTEESFGAKTPPGAEEPCGGNIDLVIWPGKAKIEQKPIAIENKVWANDQEEQLVRYRNCFKESGCYLYYLILDGRPATEYSAGKELDHTNAEKGYLPISYEVIFDWLNICLPQISDTNVIQSIKSYIQVIKNLTKHHRNNQMQQELFEVISSAMDKYAVGEEFLALQTAVSNYIPNLSSRFSNNLSGHLAKYNMSVEPVGNFGKNWHQTIKIKPHGWKNCYIGLGFDGEYNHKPSFFGGFISLNAYNENYLNNNRKQLDEDLQNIGLKGTTETEFIWYGYFGTNNDGFLMEGKQDWATEDILYMNNSKNVATYAKIVKQFYDKVEGISWL